MTATNAHLKLSIRDVYSCAVSDDGSTFFCSLFSEPNARPILFKNVRLSGLVVKQNDVSFALDDGTGVIVIKIPQNSQLDIPKISDYVEVFGQLEGRNDRSVIALCCCLRNDPMEEIRHLLEQAAIHRDYLQFRKLSQQSFLSSEASAPNPFEQLVDKVMALLGKSDPKKGVKFGDIKEVCGGEDNVTKKVIESMKNSGMLYDNNDAFFPL